MPSRGRLRQPQPQQMAGWPPNGTVVPIPMWPFFGGSPLLSLSLSVSLNPPSTHVSSAPILPLEQTAFGVAHVVDASGALVPAYVVHGEGNARRYRGGERLRIPKRFRR